MPGSIFITVKAIPLTQSRVQCKPSLRSLLPFQKEVPLNEATFSPARRSLVNNDNSNVTDENATATHSSHETNGQFSSKQHNNDENITKWLNDSSINVAYSGTDDHSEHWWRHKSPKVPCKVPIVPWKEFSAGNLIIFIILLFHFFSFHFVSICNKCFFFHFILSPLDFQYNLQVEPLTLQSITLC